MAHNLNYNSRTQTYSFASTQPAWHGLGQIVDKAMTAEEAITLAGLDYTVIKKQQRVVLDDGTIIENPDSFATINLNNNTILGTVGKVYEVVQNKDAFGFFTDFAGESAAMFETAGALGNGEQIFISCKLPDILTIGKKDNVEEYLLLTNSHNGKDKIKVLFTPIRVVCNNTLNQALSKGNYTMKYEVKHTTNFKDKLEEARKLMGIHKISLKNQSEIFNLLYNTPITDVQAKNEIFSILCTPQEMKLIAMNNMQYQSVEELSTKKINTLTAVEAYLNAGVGQAEIAGTAWWAFNALTGYYQNCKTYASKDDMFTSITNGLVLKNTTKLFENLVALSI